MAVFAAPLRPELPRVFAGAFGDQAEAVDADLRLHDLALFLAVPTLDCVNLPGKRRKARALALVQKELKLVVGRAFCNRPAH